MIRSRPSPRRALPVALALAAGVAALPTSGFAQQAAAPAATRPATGDTIRLSEQEKNAILDSNTAESAAAARGELTGPERAGLGIHGEIGAMIGTHGTRGIYGTAAIPLGENAGAVVSFESSRYGYRRR